MPTQLSAGDTERFSCDPSDRESMNETQQVCKDSVLFLGVTGRGAGELLPEVVYLCRNHAHQMTEQTDYRDASEYDARRFAFLHGQELHRAARRQRLAGSATP